MFMVGEKAMLKNPQHFPYVGSVSGEVEVVAVDRYVGVKVTDGDLKGFSFEVDLSELEPIK